MKLLFAILKILAGALVYAIALAISGAVFPMSPGFSAVPPDEAGFVLPALLIVGVVFSSILYYFALRSNRPTLGLALRTTAVFYLINTFQSQVETFYFRAAFPMITDADIVAMFAGGALIAVLYIPAALYLARLGTVAPVKAEPDFSFTRSWWKMALAALAYLPLYLGFGMIAQLAPTLRAEYAAWIADERLVALLPLWQLLRGALFALLAALIFSLFDRRRSAFIAGALTLSLFISALLILPSSIMSQQLRLVHFGEITASMVVYALCAGALLTRKKAA